jgi:hypothetical protein
LPVNSHRKGKRFCLTCNLVWLSTCRLPSKKFSACFVQAVACQGAWLAIRRGDTLDIQAEWNAPKARGASLLIDENPIFRRVNRSLADLLLLADSPILTNFHSLPETQRRRMDLPALSDRATLDRHCCDVASKGIYDWQSEVNCASWRRVCIRRWILL